MSTTHLNPLVLVPLPVQTGPGVPLPSPVASASAEVALAHAGTAKPGIAPEMLPRSLSLHDDLMRQLPPQPLDAFPPCPEAGASTTPPRLPIRSPDEMCHSAMASVAQAAVQLETLLITGDVPAMAWVLWSLAEDLAPALTQPPDTMDMVLKAALQAMSKCNSLVVRAHLMGACHHLHTSVSYASAWRSALRGEKAASAVRSHSTVLRQYLPLLDDQAQRADALKAMVVHLSWLAPVWSEDDSVRHRRHLNTLRSGLNTLFDALNKPYAALSSDAERVAFRNDVLAAFGPATCSRLLARSLPGAQHIPFWLDDQLLTAREHLLASDGVQVFPMECNILQLSRVELVRRGDAPRDMVQESITSMVNEVATQIETLLDAGDPVALSAALETQALTLSQALGLPGNPATLTRAQMVAQQAMVACGPVVRAHLLGSCGYIQSECVFSSYWRRDLSFDSQKNGAMGYAHVFDGYKAEFGNPTTRASAIKGLMVHMSWIVPTPLPGNKHSIDLHTVLNDLFKAMQTESDKAITSEELTAFREDFLAAIVPECCSFLLIPLLEAAKNVPHWLQVPLRLALEQLKTMGGQFFPLQPNLKTSGQAAQGATRILLPVLPRLLTRAPLLLAHPRPTVLLPEAPNALVGDERRIKRMVGAVASHLELLLGNAEVDNNGNLTTASAALKTFARTLEQPPTRGDELLPSIALFAWETMLACKPFVGAHLLGVCHFFHIDSAPGARWPRLLRHNERKRDAVSIGFVIDKHAAQLDGPVKRVDALKSMLAHLSWLAQPWYRPGDLENQHKESLEAAVRKLVQVVQASYFKLQTRVQRTVFLQQMAAAIGPTCCSPLLARHLKFHVQRDVAPLLESALLPVVLKIEAANDSSLFPAERPLIKGRRKKMVEKSPPAAVAGSKRPPDGVRDESSAAVRPQQRRKTDAAADALLLLCTPPPPLTQMPLPQQGMPSAWHLTQPIPFVPLLPLRALPFDQQQRAHGADQIMPTRQAMQRSSSVPLVPLLVLLPSQTQGGQFVIPRRSPLPTTLQTTPFFQAQLAERTVETTTTTTTTSTTATTTTTEATAATLRTPSAAGRR